MLMVKIEKRLPTWLRKEVSHWNHERFLALVNCRMPSGRMITPESYLIDYLGDGKYMVLIKWEENGIYERRTS